MKPNGEKSHLTPINHFLRFFTSLGSAGSFGFAGLGLAVGPARAATFPPGAAVPQAANAAAANTSAATTMVMRFIQPLLLRWSALPKSPPGGACGGGNAAFALPSGGRGRQRDCPARRSCPRP